MNRWLRLLLPLLVLAAPSVWLLASVPPLWRDIDAYVQTVYPPGANTLLLHGPLYCMLSRGPLWLGYLVSGTGPAVSLDHFIRHSQLTDPGIFGLLLLQHLGLWVAALYLITAAAAGLVARVLLALFFASQPLFYTFAHCVGSETLSLILTLFLAGYGLRLVFRRTRITPRDWLIWAALLCCCVLTRQINRILPVILPIAIGLLFLLHWFRQCRSRVDGTVAKKSEAQRLMRTALIASLVGVAALLWATALVHALCWRTHIEWRSKLGYTFTWRLNFLPAMDSSSRDRLLQTVAAKCRLSESRQLIELLRHSSGENKPWDAAQFVRDAETSLFPTAAPWSHNADFDRVLNDVARSFLIPPSAALATAAFDDFMEATRRSESDVARYLVLTTDFYFDHSDAMSQLAGLQTYREPREHVMALSELPYFRWWSAFSFRTWSAVAVVVFLLAVLLNRRGDGSGTPSIVFAVSLAMVGTIMLLLNCCFTQFQERFILTAMEFLLVSIMILLGFILSNGRARKLSAEAD